MQGALTLPPAILRKLEFEPMSGCWLWNGGSLSPSGYANERWGGGRNNRRMAHRIVYELLVGAIPPGLTLDHRCRVRTCCNPQHLRPCTIGENLLAPGSLTFQARNAAKVKCVNGHAFDTLNTYRRTRPGAGRACRTCKAESQRRRRAAKRKDMTT